MKSTKDFRSKPTESKAEDTLRKAMKLDPIKKSGKEKRKIYHQLEDEDEDEDLRALRKTDSILDYFDDGEEEDEDLEEEFEEEEDEWEDDENEEEEEWDEEGEDEDDEPHK